MIHIKCTQGDDRWIQARLGIPTASRFSSILTPKTMKLSSQADGYMNELLAEWILGRPVDDTQTQFMERGTDMEPSAVAYYEFQREVTTEEVGFCLRDDRRVGCSPDRLVGDNGGLEIKVPGAKKHVSYLLGNPPEQYKVQIQGGLWICEREFWDFLSYNPDIPSVILRCPRDEPFIRKLADVVDAFLDRLEEAKERMRAMGCVGADEQLQKDLQEAAAREAAIAESVFGPPADG